jgi:hypothetical protein
MFISQPVVSGIQGNCREERLRRAQEVKMKHNAVRNKMELVRSAIGPLWKSAVSYSEVSPYCIEQ